MKNGDFKAFKGLYGATKVMGVRVNAYKTPPDGLASLISRVMVKNGVYGKSKIA